MVLKPPHRREVLSGLTALALAPAAKANTRPFSFMALGDWGHDGSRHQTAVAHAMAAAAQEVGSRFVISAGDNFYPAGVDSVDDPQWRTSFEGVYTAASLQTPWYAALGNHDYRGMPHAQVAYGRTNGRWRMPHRYYQVSGADLGAPSLDLFVLDTTPLMTRIRERVTELAHGQISLQDPDRQVAWLEAALRTSTAERKIVVGHHPIHSGGHHGDTRALVQSVKPLLETYGVHAYVCGHDHALQHIRRDGVDYVCSGAGASAGFVLPVEGMRFRGTHPGFAIFTLDGRDLGLEFRDQTGRSVYRTALA